MSSLAITTSTILIICICLSGLSIFHPSYLIEPASSQPTKMTHFLYMTGSIHWCSGCQLAGNKSWIL